MKHPLILQAEENVREMEFELEGIRKGIARLSSRIDYMKGRSGRLTEEAERFGDVLRDCMRMLGVGPEQVPASLRKYL